MPIASCAFVSTNSITQGETAASLWPNLKIEIDFAYRTFKWHNEAKDNAAVHCVIIGFHCRDINSDGCQKASVNTSAGFATSNHHPLRNVSGASDQIGVKTIYDGDKVIPAKHINCYLVDAPDVIAESRAKPICDVPAMVYGNNPTDGGHLLLTPEEKDLLLSTEPQAAQFVKPILGSVEFLNRQERYCLRIVGANPAVLANCPQVKARIELVRQMRLSSKAEATRKYAPMGGLFRQITQPEGKDHILVPCVSPERREYVPIGFLTLAARRPPLRPLRGSCEGVTVSLIWD